MATRTHSLRSVLTSGTLLLAGTAVLAALAVIALTTEIHRASVSIETSTRSVHVAEQSEIDLLLHAQAKDGIMRRALAGSIQRKLSEAEDYLETDRERLVLDEAKARVQEYVLASRDAGRPEEELTALHAAAYSALDELIAINVDQAATEAGRAARIDYIASIGGISLALFVLCVAAFFVYWVRGPLILPVLDLAGAMDQFGRGDLASRTRISGPREMREMAQRFNEMAARIERQTEQQRAFLAGVAHDLRNPVSAILLAAEAARADASLPPDHPARQALDRTARQLRKMNRMLADFLDAAMLEAGNLELRLELCDPSDVVRSTTELFEGTSSQHELISFIPKRPLRARIDPLRIEQVTGNLISNAIKYSPQGGTVELRLEQRGDEFMLAVTDHGLGMSPETQSHLFQPFRRGLPREGIPGMGLGLFITRRILDAHHGRIEVESSLGAGSTFRVFLPSDSAEDVGVDPC